jgi:hypothetical protein
LYGVVLPQGFDSNKEDFAYCSCISIVVILYSGIRFLTSGIRELSRAGVVGNYFLFLQIFFGEEKRGPRHSRHFQYISMQNLQKKVVYLSFSQKNTQFKKKNRPKRSPEGQDIEVLKSANFQGFFCRRRRDLFLFMYHLEVEFTQINYRSEFFSQFHPISKKKSAETESEK